MDTQRLFWELQRLDLSFVIVEDEVLGLGTILSLDDNIISFDLNGSSTSHSGINREWHSYLETELLV
jgi:hypothetical protein